MSCKTAFLTTVFPMDKQYLIDFFDSLQEQTYKAFDVIVINDGFDGFDTFISKYNTLNIIELLVSNTPAKNREFGINYVKDNGYDVLVFGDSDDYFSPNRIQVAMDNLKAFDIVVNDLTLFNSKGLIRHKYISNRIENGTRITLSFIKNKNIFGLSNTAIQVKSIDKVLFDKNLVAVDWHFFSILLLKKCTAVFTNKSVTYYRQHISNTVGLGQITNDLIMNGLDVKINHYELMKKKSPQFESLLSRMYQLQEKVKDVDYMEKLKEVKTKNPLWWEAIENVEF